MKHYAKASVSGVLFSYDDVDRPQIKITEGGLEYCRFEIRTNLYDRDGNQKFREGGEPSQFRFKCVAWAVHARDVAALRCGDTATVGGDLTRSKNPKTEEWQDEIKVSFVRLEAPDPEFTPAPDEKVEFPDVSEIINLDDEEDYI